jgi:hypothetical protein
LDQLNQWIARTRGTADDDILPSLHQRSSCVTLASNVLRGRQSRDDSSPHGAEGVWIGDWVY